MKILALTKGVCLWQLLQESVPLLAAGTHEQPCQREDEHLRNTLSTDHTQRWNVATSKVSKQSPVTLSPQHNDPYSSSWRMSEKKNPSTVSPFSFIMKQGLLHWFNQVTGD